MDKLRKGDIVSCGPITGEVIELRRRTDGQPFLMVEYTSGPRKGTREFPDAGWHLGVGTEDCGCERCCRRFLAKSDDPNKHECHSCRRSALEEQRRRQADPERSLTSFHRKQLRGTRS